jgi:hypothetical protein
MAESEYLKEERFLDETVVSKIKQILVDAGIGSEIQHLKISEASATKLITLLINSILIENATLKRALREMKARVAALLQMDIDDFTTLPRR